jgi:hypothetical protein
MPKSKYRKKPVVIEAMQITDEGDWSDASDWCGGVVKQDFAGPGGIRWMEITTLEGVMCADADDWIICGVKGEFYPCKPDIFEATYESVE